MRFGGSRSRGSPNRRKAFVCAIPKKSLNERRPHPSRQQCIDTIVYFCFASTPSPTGEGFCLCYIENKITLCKKLYYFYKIYHYFQLRIIWLTKSLAVMPTRKLTHERVIPKRYSSLGVCRGANGGRIATPPVKRLLWLLSLRKKKVTISLKECNFSCFIIFKKITFSLKNYRDIVSKKI